MLIVCVWTLNGILTLPLSICKGTLFTKIEKVPAHGAEWLLIRVTYRLLATVPDTKPVILELGKEVIAGRYLSSTIIYSYPWTSEGVAVTLPNASKRTKVTVGL